MQPSVYGLYGFSPNSGWRQHPRRPRYSLIQLIADATPFGIRA